MLEEPDTADALEREQLKIPVFGAWRPSQGNVLLASPKGCIHPYPSSQKRSGKMILTLPLSSVATHFQIDTFKKYLYTWALRKAYITWALRPTSQATSSVSLERTQAALEKGLAKNTQPTLATGLPPW